VRDFRRFDVWHDSIALGKTIYEMTAGFPREERYGLTAQMRSAAVSISSNIAEGAGRGSRKELARFLKIAVGSVNELDSQIHFAVELGIIGDRPAATAEVDRLRRRLVRLVERVEE
jgi:four helix bundle protein